MMSPINSKILTIIILTKMITMKESRTMKMAMEKSQSKI